MIHRFVQYSLISICEKQYTRIFGFAESRIDSQTYSNCSKRCYSICRNFDPGSTRVGIMNK